GQLWSQTSPDTGTTTFEYNAAGQRTKMTRADGTVTLYAYDSLGRVTSISAGADIQVFAYDTCTKGKGRLCEMQDAHGVRTYTYAPYGRIAAQGQTIGTSSVNYGQAYAYDNMGRLTGISYPGGVSVGYGYAQGKLA